MENQHAVNGAGKPFHSSTGSVVDVATPSARRLRALGFLWALISLFPLAIINYLIIEALKSPDPILSPGHPGLFLGALLMPLIAWYALGSAVQRFRAASTDERYFRSGPGGVSVCLPNDDFKSTFLFSFKICKFDLPWDQVKTWYPYVHSMNGIATERSIVFETLKGEKLKIKTYHFAEKQKQIVANITRTRSMSTVIVEPNCMPNMSQPDSENKAFRLPPGVGELSLQIKKKKDPVKEIDLGAVPGTQRTACFERTADLLEEEMVSLCPPAAGYKYSRKRYRPFKEWKEVFGIRLFVRRGLLDGYEIQLEPNDSECRRLTISMCSSSLISDIRKYVSMVVGAAFVLISFKWLPVIQYWLGDFARLTPIVMFAIFLAAVALSTGLLQLPISLLRLLVSNKQNQEAQRQDIKLGIQGMAI